MSSRKLLHGAQALLRRAAAEGYLGSSLLNPSRLLQQQQRSTFSTLPEDLAAAAKNARFPVRRNMQPSASASAATAAEASGVAAAAGGAPAAAAPAAATATQQAAVTNAQAGSPWMFPWERRQLQGGELRWWEKMYWGVFVVGIALILFNRIEWEKEPDPAEIERKRRLEEARMEAARLVLAGKSILVPWGTDDPFAGMSPTEIEEFCSTATGGASQEDPFEGMTPEEIDEYIEKHGLPQVM